MGSIFCVSCGTKNRTPIAVCSKCGRLFVSSDFTKASSWEQIQTAKEKVEEKLELNFWQRAQKRPFVLAISVITILLCAGLTIRFTFLSTKLSKCLEYRQYDCSIIVLERKVTAGELIGGEFITVDKNSFNRVQAESLDLMRLIAISLDSKSRVSSHRIIINSARNGRGSGGCSDVEACKIASKVGDVDYEGLMGSLGLTNLGILQRAYFSSTVSANPTWVFQGMLNSASDFWPNQIFDVDEIHLVSDEISTLKVLHVVAAQFKTELQRSGINLRVIVSLEGYSRNSRKSVARIIVKRGLDSLRPFNTAVKLSFGDFVNQDKWGVNLNYSVEHLQVVAAKAAMPEGRSLLIADCLVNPLTEAKSVIGNLIAVESVCIGSSRYEELVVQSQSSKLEDQILVIGGSSESKVLQKVYSEIKRSTHPIFVLRP